MSVYDLPTALFVGGEMKKIRSDYRAVLDICAALSDPELNDRDKAAVMLTILYEDPQAAMADPEEAVKQALWFIGGGDEAQDARPRPKLMDWEQDFPVLVGAINRVAGTEIRALPYLHWWTFISYYMEIGECSFAQIVAIRNKKARGKKLEKWEQDYYKDNKSLIDFKRKPMTEAEQEALEAILGVTIER